LSETTDQSTPAGPADTASPAGSAEEIVGEQVPDDAESTDASEPTDGVESTDASVETADGAEPADPATAASSHKRRLVQEGDIAADYLEGLLDIADLDGDIDMDVDGDRAAVSIAGGDLGHLVGRDGEVLDALQELTRLAVLRETGERSRLMLDIEGHRARRRVELTEIGAQAADKVKSLGEPVSLPAMTPFERKIVHDAVAAAGLVSESEGVEPMRYVVVHPA
jgi:spoIIIJ-associated protein